MPLPSSILMLIVCVIDPAGPAAIVAPVLRSEWQTIVLLRDTPTFTLPGTWQSVERKELESSSQDDQGVWHYRYKTVAENRIRVEPTFIEALVTSGQPTDRTVPTDCRLALKWTRANHCAWWSTEACDAVKDDQCRPCKASFVQIDATEEEVERGEQRPVLSRYRTCFYDVNAVKQHRVRECRLPAAQGEVTITRDGHVSIGAFNEEAHPERFAILGAVNTNGDVFFWVVGKP